MAKCGLENAVPEKARTGEQPIKVHSNTSYYYKENFEVGFCSNSPQSSMSNDCVSTYNSGLVQPQEVSSGKRATILG